MSNLAAGAENDPFAPWNRNSILCKYCDADILRDQIYQDLISDDDCDDDCVEEIVDERLSQQPLCPNCAKEEYYDYTDED